MKPAFKVFTVNAKNLCVLKAVNFINKRYTNTYLRKYFVKFDYIVQSKNLGSKIIFVYVKVMLSLDCYFNML